MSAGGQSARVHPLDLACGVPLPSVRWQEFPGLEPAQGKTTRAGQAQRGDGGGLLDQLGPGLSRLKEHFGLFFY